MKTVQITLMAFTCLLIAACSSAKKSTTSVSGVAPPMSVSPAPPPATNIFVLANPALGIHSPGNEELMAIQAQYNEVTLEKLKEGYTIYTQGACINCHGAINIYRYGETQWKHIIDDMAQRAAISDAQKDAVYKYVLAIKTTQPK